MSLAGSLRHLCRRSCTISALVEVEGFESGSAKEWTAGDEEKARIKGPFVRGPFGREGEVVGGGKQRGKGGVDTGLAEEEGNAISRMTTAPITQCAPCHKLSVRRTSYILGKQYIPLALNERISNELIDVIMMIIARSLLLLFNYCWSNTA